jgi:hypothetical protein
VVAAAVSVQSADATEQKRDSRSRESDPCARTSNFWRRTANARYRASCNLLDRARTNLHSRPQLSLDLAASVLKNFPDFWEAHILSGHALFLLGREQEAHEAFSELESPQGGTLLSMRMAAPHLWASAQAALRVGDDERALLRYRTLLLQIGELSQSNDRARVLVEASVASLFYSGDTTEVWDYLQRSGQENAPLLALVRSALIRVLGKAEPGVSTVRRDTAPLYWKLLAQFNMLEQDPPSGQEPRLGWLTLPRGAIYFLLAKVARDEDPERSQVHYAALACLEPQVSSAFLRAELKSQNQLNCPAEPVDDEDLAGEEEGE